MADLVAGPLEPIVALRITVDAKNQIQVVTELTPKEASMLLQRAGLSMTAHIQESPVQQGGVGGEVPAPNIPGLPKVLVTG